MFASLQGRIRERFDAVKQQCSVKPDSGVADTEEAVGPMLSPDLVEWWVLQPGSRSAFDSVVDTGRPNRLSELARDVVSQLVFARQGAGRLPLDGDPMVDVVLR